MKATFFEYNLGMAGIFTARANLNVVGHNLANVQTPGFSRQYTLQRASRPLALRNGKGMYGTGSEVYGIAQMRDIYLDNKFWQQKGVQGEYVTKNTHLSLMETIFNDLNDANVLKSFTNYFARLQELSQSPEDATYRSNVVSAAATLASMINANAEALLKQQHDVNREVGDTVTLINSLGDQIVALNAQIRQYESDGSNANDLRDQRAVLVDILSKFVNIEAQEYDFSTPDYPNKQYTVMINGYDFINNDRCSRLMVVPREPAPPSKLASGKPIENSPGPTRNVMDAPGLYDICFADTGGEFNIYSRSLKGTLKGLIDIRDGNNTMGTVQYDSDNDGFITDADRYYATTPYRGIPFYMNKLNTLVRTFARAVNEGLDVNGDPIKGISGNDMMGHMYAYDKNNQNLGMLMFTYSAATHPADGPVTGTGDASDFLWTTNANGDPMLDYTLLTCLNFTANPQLVADPFKLAASSDPAKGESNNDVILDIQKLNNYPHLFKEGKLLDFIVGTADHMAIDLNQAENFELNYEEVIMQTDNQRMSVSGVSINEEMQDLMKFQQLFQACAKFINVINSIYDTMINRLGAF